MKKIGTQYGGWHLPDKMQRLKIISAGAGEDISFELAANYIYNCPVTIIDPTPRAILHYKNIAKFYYSDPRFRLANLQKGYLNYISQLRPDFTKIQYIPKALWKDNSVKEFYFQDKEEYVSCTLIPEMYSSNNIQVSCLPIQDLIAINESFVLKLDIEGAECEVLLDVLDKGYRPEAILVEFDLLDKGKDCYNITKTVKKRLAEYYSLICDDSPHKTFIRK